MNIPAIDLSGSSPITLDASPALLRDLLNEWEGALRERSFPVDDAFHPGVDEIDVRAQLKSIGLGAPAELLVWFGWHNGQPWAAPRVTPAFSTLSDLATAISRREDQRPFFGDTFGTWGPDWLPICNERASLAVDTESDTAPRVRMVDFLEFGTWGESAQTQTLSLCTAVTWFLEALVSGAHVWDAEAGGWRRTTEIANPVALAAGYV